MDPVDSLHYKTSVRYRALFLSDIHLAARASRSAELVSFLQMNDAETIYLVGDLIDFWRLRRGRRWSLSQTQVVKELLAKAQAGTRIIYIPGNHDEEMRAFAGMTVGPVELCLRALHETSDGRRFLVIHGDEFDFVIKKARWLAVLGDVAYDAAIAANVFLAAIRRMLGLSYWSLSAYLKYRVKQAVNSAGSFEVRLAAEARKTGAEGVICGHVHHASMRIVEGIQYINTGDWVESGTAVVEHFDGRFEIIPWLEKLRKLQANPSRASVASVTTQ